MAQGILLTFEVRCQFLLRQQVLRGLQLLQVFRVVLDRIVLLGQFPVQGGHGCLNAFRRLLRLVRGDAITGKALPQFLQGVSLPLYGTFFTFARGRQAGKFLLLFNENLILRRQFGRVCRLCLRRSECAFACLVQGAGLVFVCFDIGDLSQHRLGHFLQVAIAVFEITHRSVALLSRVALVFHGLGQFVHCPGQLVEGLLRVVLRADS
ncbi:hypothetical protein SOP91_00390 (plasmid) [Enterobacter hormaechei]|uniref:hypothetical protein n=1 Tax=Enterobacter hormaechei TaxID=158836 RepID=UPI002B4C1BDA|nr:hypothetical protein [Enterobacter hormaechei]WRM07090.1 hypothetical protein SOP91_00390 [Enterobacter hormaechei]